MADDTQKTPKLDEVVARVVELERLVARLRLTIAQLQQRLK